MSTFRFSLILHCPSFRADIITAVKARSPNIFIQSVLKHCSDRSPCRLEDILGLSFYLKYFVLVTLITIFCAYTGHLAIHVRRDGSGVDGEVRKVDGHPEKEEILREAKL